MVHLSRVRKGKHARRQDAEESGDSSAAPYVYATHYAAEELPEHELAEREMPAAVVKRMIQDELSLDGNPLLK
ncbi:uncharacterized protein LDX57_007494 [Aspergillus melleus]|uniref:uncharacterized protein n=1 Tax=Aspergillus melleus TaxID=138277 RepID=UPI001E8EED35|nr:uncharacterized protein LDX57_007494 [Aspergillus melleus]KAH8429823.1 hypothetical protein LDX57_007494 [Aspergillus melleus]